MINLETIRVVQFYLFERQELKIDEVSGIFGPNGAGKSSMLDAAQIAMFGGNSRYSALNAQADEKASSRTLRTYCLGQYGDNIEQRARDVATTYITLIWRNTVTNEPISMGVCLYSSVDRDKHEVLGRYIIKGLELTMGDHLEAVGDDEMPRDWKVFRHNLSKVGEKLGISSSKEIFFDSSDKFMNAYLLALRGEKPVSNRDSFVRSFRFAMRMRFDKSVDEIVRYDVLESRPTHIKKFREITESFRKLSQLVTNVEKKIDSAKIVAGHFGKADEEKRQSITWNAINKLAQSEYSQAEYDANEEESEDAKEQLEIKTTELNDLQKRIVSKNEEKDRVRIKREEHSAHKDYGRLQTEIDTAKNKLSNDTQTLKRQIEYLKKTILDVSNHYLMEEFKTKLQQASNKLNFILENDELIINDEFYQPIRGAIKQADKAYSFLINIYRDNQIQSQRIQENLNNAKSSLERLKKGHAPISHSTEKLLTEFRDHGLNPVVVSELVEIKDQSWQPIIEAYLKNHIEAILIEGEEDEKKAFSIYRGLKGNRAIYGAKIVLASRQKTDRTYASDTVASLIDGKYNVAVAYLRRQFGNIQQANSNADAMSGVRTLTIDGMLLSHGELDRIRPIKPEMFRIGSIGQGHKEAILKQYRDYQSQSDELAKSGNEINGAMEKLDTVRNEKTTFQYLSRLCEDIERSSKDIDVKTSLFEDIADDEYVQLGEDESKLNDKIKELNVLLNVINKNMGSLSEKVKLLEIKLQESHSKLLDKKSEYEIAKSNDYYDDDFKIQRWDSLTEKFGDNFKNLEEHCSSQNTNATNRMNQAINRGQATFWDFLSEYGEQGSISSSEEWSKSWKWLIGLIERLENTTLSEYREEMERAYQTSQDTFRNDVAQALNDNIQRLDSNLENLNCVLKNCPAFSNGERYKFVRRIRPENESLLKFIKDVGTYGPNEDLFGGAGDIPEEFKELLEIDESASNPLDDYREFYEFDIDIFTEDVKTGKEKRVGKLSKRLGPGSGGEHRAPLYVIAGAALSAAYNISNSTQKGIRLILLDEAFNKMDEINIIATMRYLEDLGLQILMASPGEYQGILTPFLYRYYDISRDSENNSVILEGHTVSSTIRNTFREDLAEFNPSLITKEMKAIESELTQKT